MQNDTVQNGTLGNQSKGYKGAQQDTAVRFFFFFSASRLSSDTFALTVIDKASTHHRHDNVECYHAEERHFKCFKTNTIRLLRYSADSTTTFGLYSLRGTMTVNFGKDKLSVIGQTFCTSGLFRCVPLTFRFPTSRGAMLFV